MAGPEPVTDVTLTQGQIRKLAGGLTQPRRQLTELHKRGFWRARLGTDGRVVLETAHYQAVCAGALPPGAVKGDTASRPRLQAVR